jgi:hypothetical protein
MFSQIVEDKGINTPQTHQPASRLGQLEAALRAQGVPEQAIQARMQAEKIMKRPITGQTTGKGTTPAKTQRDAPGLSNSKGTTKDQSR